MTRQEKAFNKFCEDNAISIEKIPVTHNQPGERRSDFLVGNGHKAIFELTEMQPNKNDKSDIEDSKNNRIFGGTTTIGKRSRKIIKSKYQQLKKTSETMGNLPAILVLSVDREIVMGHFLELDDIQAAMYGDHVVTVDFSQKTFVCSRFGGNRTATEEHNTYLSAVCTMHYRERPKFNVYHNFFAKNPLQTNVFSGNNINHWGYPNPHGKKFNRLPNWEILT